MGTEPGRANPSGFSPYMGREERRVQGLDYCSDDSEFNYIPSPYVIEAIEDEEANANEAAASPTDDTLDPDTFKLYEDEPIASEEWVSEYEKRQESQAEFERKLKDRYEGIQLVNSRWVFVASFDLLLSCRSILMLFELCSSLWSFLYVFHSPYICTILEVQMWQM